MLNLALNLSRRAAIVADEKRSSWLSFTLVPIVVPSLERDSTIPSVVAGAPKMASIILGANLSMLITLSAPVTIAILALRCASRRGRITRLRPTEPLTILTASSVFSRKARVEIASTTLFFCNRRITSWPNSGARTLSSSRRAVNVEALVPGVF